MPLRHCQWGQLCWSAPPTLQSPYLPQSTVECLYQWFSRRVHRGVKWGYFLNSNNKLNSIDIMALIWKAAFPNRYFPERNIPGRKFQWWKAKTCGRSRIFGWEHVFLCSFFFFFLKEWQFMFGWAMVTWRGQCWQSLKFTALNDNLGCY